MSFAPMLDALQRRASPEQREWVSRLRSGTPEAIAAIARSVHGIDVATWACACGAGYQYPSRYCAACRAPYPRRCLSDGCASVVPGPEAEAGVTHCVECTGDVARKARAASFARSPIPIEAKQAVLAFSTGWDHQRPGSSVIKRWLSLGPQALPWRKERTHHISAKSNLFLGGSTGSGKTTLAARLVWSAHVDRGLVDSFVWHTHKSLADLFQARYSPDDGERTEAVRAWRVARFTPLLVIDDLFAERLTPAFGEAVSSLLRERMDDVLATVETSNVGPEWTEYFGDLGRMDSRFARDGEAVTVSGVDIRAEQAKRAP